MMKKITIVASISILLLATACKTTAIQMDTVKKETAPEKKEVVYQVFTRLFGNQNTTNKKMLSIEILNIDTHFGGCFLVFYGKIIS